MARKISNSKKNSTEVTNDELVEIICEQLRHWKAACDHAGTDTVFITQQAFGKSQEEILLNGLAIRYAGIVGKAVTIYPNSEAQALDS